MPDPAPLTWISASVPKPGHKAAENEDATAAHPGRMRFAVADGATEGWQSGGWAKHLATAYARRPPTPADFPDWLAAARGAWVPPAGGGAAWYAEVKQEQGSFSTLLGVEFRESATRKGLAWKAVAVGDSCLLVLRNDRVEVAFPLSRPDEFGTRPALVPSPAGARCPDPDWLAGRADPGDLVVLATDAVARYLLAREPPVGRDPVVAAVRAAVASGTSDPVVESLLGLSDVLNDDASVVAVVVPA
jgi:hypothetical protein